MINECKEFWKATIEHCSQEERDYIASVLNRWIPVSERLPEESLNCVLGWDDNRERCVFVQYVNGRFQFMGRDSNFKITAWMPLPEPYKAESEEM